jgi:hypothetical protein
LGVRIELEKNPEFQKILENRVVTSYFHSQGRIDYNTNLLGQFSSDLNDIHNNEAQYGHNSFTITFFTAAVKKYQQIARGEKIFVDNDSFKEAIKQLENCLRDSQGQLSPEAIKLVNDLKALVMTEDELRSSEQKNRAQ